MQMMKRTSFVLICIHLALFAFMECHGKAVTALDNCLMRRIIYTIFNKNYCSETYFKCLRKCGYI